MRTSIISETDSDTVDLVSFIAIIEIRIILVFDFTNCSIVVRLHFKFDLKKNEGSGRSHQKRNLLETLHMRGILKIR